MGFGVEASVDCGSDGSPIESYYSSWYDRMRRDSNLLYKPRTRTVSSSSSTSTSCSRRSSAICNSFDLEELEEVVEDEAEVVQRLKAWVDQLASLRSADPFVGLPVDEQSPVGRGDVERTDPYHGLQWETRESWQVESWEGSLDPEGRWHGKGLLRLAGGGEVAGVWKAGKREGKATITSPTNGIVSLVGEYRGGKMCGSGRLILEDGSLLEGRLRDGCLHGLARRLNEKRRLVWVGRHVGGKPSGVCWSFVSGGGAVVGKVDSKGKLTGDEVAYIYPDNRTAIVGRFEDGVLVSGRATSIKSISLQKGVVVPVFNPGQGPLLEREIATQEKICSLLTIREPYEERFIEVRGSGVDGGGEGVFAKVDLSPDTVVAFYNGVRLPPGGQGDEEEDWEKCSYRIFLHSEDGEEDEVEEMEQMDIPMELRDTSVYCATSAHKINHSFQPNCRFSRFNHPRFGPIPCVTTTQHVKEGEELFSYYRYLLSDCPDWYLSLWEQK